MSNASCQAVGWADSYSDWEGEEWKPIVFRGMDLVCFLFGWVPGLWALLWMGWEGWGSMSFPASAMETPLPDAHALGVAHTSFQGQYRVKASTQFLSQVLGKLNWKNYQNDVLSI